MAEARSLADIKLDNAYKFGAGRYLQEAGALNLLGGEVARLGKKALVIAGPRAWAATEGKAEKSLKDAGVEFELSLYPDQNTYERAKEHALQALTRSSWAWAAAASWIRPRLRHTLQATCPSWRCLPPLPPARHLPR